MLCCRFNWVLRDVVYQVGVGIIHSLGPVQGVVQVGTRVGRGRGL
jgi:hypothetical protein